MKIFPCVIEKYLLDTYGNLTRVEELNGVNFIKKDTIWGIRNEKNL